MRLRQRYPKSRICWLCFAAIMACSLLTGCAAAWKKEPNLQQTSDFLISKIQGMSATARVYGTKGSCTLTAHRSVEYTKVIITDQRVQIYEQDWLNVYAPDCKNEEFKYDPWEETLEFTYGELAVDSLKIVESPPAIVDLPGVVMSNQMPMYGISLNFNNPVKTTYKDETRSSKTWTIYLADKELAGRVLEALKHAAFLCGAKKELF
jgi:hypothetical protein